MAVKTELKLISATDETKSITVSTRFALLNVESIEQSTGQPKEVYYGAVANSGTARILDVNGEILKAINDGVLPQDDLKAQIIVNDCVVREHVITDTEYTPNGVLDLQMTSGIDNLNNVIYEGYFSESGATLYDIVVDGFYRSFAVEKENADSVLFGDNETVINRLKSISYTPAFVPSMAFKDFIDKVCNVAFLSFVEVARGLNITTLYSHSVVLTLGNGTANFTLKSTHSAPYTSSAEVLNDLAVANNSLDTALTATGTITASGTTYNIKSIYAETDGSDTQFAIMGETGE